VESFQELKLRALRNPSGKIVPFGFIYPEPYDISMGCWRGTGDTVDIYYDVATAIHKLSSDPKYIVGSHATLEPLCKNVDYNRIPIWFMLAPLFWFHSDTFPGEKDFIKFDDSADDGIVIVVGKDGSAVMIDTR
jgi:hypothetical protein